jgi:hypothetical protein
MKIRRISFPAVVAVLAPFAVASAVAQSPPAASSGRSECPPGARGNAPTLGEGNSGKSLSDQLAQSKGVICPPSNVDPHMAAPPPGGGNTPVIRPPGSPGGDQNVQPK